MITRACALTLFAALLAQALCAVEFDFKPLRPVDRWLFAADTPVDKDKAKPVNFKKFAFGSVLATYPYHAYHDDLPRGELRDASPFVWIDFRGGVSLSNTNGIGWNADFHFQLLFIEAAGLARQWNAAGPGERIGVFGGWLGATLPLPLGEGVFSVSAGIGGAEVRYGNNKSGGGILFAARLLAFPLWPLSASVDTTVVIRDGVQTYDFGGHIGVTVFRHLFFDAGYRATWVSESEAPVHGASFGLAFYWRWGSSSPMFDRPRRKNTW